MLYRNNLKEKSYASFNQDDFIKDHFPDRENFMDKFTISIDPEGCDDIDDAISIDNIGENYEIGIHIADVTSFLPLDHPILENIKNRVETLYLSTKKINMLPNILATKLCSLIENKVKRTFSVIITFDKDYNIINARLTRTNINVNENLSYDKFTEKYLKNDQMLNIYNIGQSIFKKKGDTRKFDSHILIEVFMILANSIVAKKLYDNSIMPLLRNHSKSIKLTDNYNTHRKLLFDRAKYISQKTETYHYGLQEQYYTHFTSPIRRYFDICVHYQLNSILYDQYTNIMPDCKFINTKKLSIQKMYDDNIKLDLAIDMYKNNLLELEAQCTIIDMKENYLLAYIEKFKIALGIKIISDKIKELYTFQIKDGEQLIMNKKKVYINFKTYSRLKIKLIPCIKNQYFSKKLQIELIEPNIKTLFIDTNIK
jgi:exosome complex exonuclease DIS3/RRP44